MTHLEPMNRRSRKARTEAQFNWHQHSHSLRYALGRGIDDGFRLDLTEADELMRGDDQYVQRDHASLYA
jgi:hypothetical protein